MEKHQKDELKKSLEHLIDLPQTQVPDAARMIADELDGWGFRVRALDIRWIVARCEIEGVVESPLDGLRKAVIWLAIGHGPVVEVNYSIASMMFELTGEVTSGGIQHPYWPASGSLAPLEQQSGIVILPPGWGLS